MQSQIDLHAYRSLLQEQLDLLDAVLENVTKMAKMTTTLESVALTGAGLKAVPNISLQHALPIVRKQPRVRGVLAAVREIVAELQGPFDKNDVVAKLKERDSELAASVSTANLRNTLRLLAKKGEIKIQIDATSTTCAKYLSKRAAA